MNQILRAFCFLSLMLHSLTPAVAAPPKVDLGNSFALALKTDGMVWGWGSNTSGQLGNGNTTDAKHPVEVSGLVNTIDIATGFNNSIALKSDGSIWTWGNNSYYSQLAGAELQDSCSSISIPCAHTELRDIIAIAAGGNYLAAVASDGTVWGWGDNYGAGSIGNGITPVSATPTQVPGLFDMTDVAIGNGHALSLKSDGSVWGWGYNLYGQLGTVTTGAILPLKVEELSEVIAISAGGYQSLAIKSDGSVWGWGSIGDSSGSAQPTQIGASMITASAISAGDRHALALDLDGTVWAWGRNDYGQLGIGEQTDSSTPQKVSGLSDIIAIVAGNNQSMAIKADGSVWIWGQIGEALTGTIDNCSFTYWDTHGLHATGNIITYNVACSLQPRQVLGADAQGFLELGTTISDARIFTYAEVNYSSLFSGSGTAGVYQKYNYRYYPASSNYLAVDNLGEIYTMGPDTNNEITSVGSVKSFMSFIKDWEAANTFALPSGYIQCAEENQRCKFSGSKDVYYGANDAYNFLHGIQNGIDCNNSSFADPIVGVVKQCYILP